MRDAAIEGPRAVQRTRTGKPPANSASASSASAKPAASKSTVRKSARPGLPARIASHFFAVFRRHPGKVLGALACLGMGGTIVGNAVLFQSGRHPAPLFGHAAPGPYPPSAPLEGAPKLAAAPVPLPRTPSQAAPPRQVDLVPAGHGSAGDAEAPAAKAGAPPASHPAAAKTPAARRADAITKLVGSTDKTPVGTAEPDPNVLAAQRSLARLGFAVKPDGRMGNATRQALDAFAQDHHLAVGTKLTPKVLRDLATAAAQPRG